MNLGLAGAGLAVGMLVGLTGMGAGSLMTPNNLKRCPRYLESIAWSRSNVPCEWMARMRHNA